MDFTVFDSEPKHEGRRWWHIFPNGYGISIVWDGENPELYEIEGIDAARMIVGFPWGNERPMRSLSAQLVNYYCKMLANYPEKNA